MTVGTTFAKKTAKERSRIASNRLGHLDRSKDLCAAFGLDDHDDRPTKERIAKGGLERPVHDQKQKRDYYRHQSPFERLQDTDQISAEQARAGLKLERHVIGSTGADARMDDGGVSDLDGIPARTRHALAVANAQKVIPWRQWSALMMLIEMTDHLHEIGGALCQRKDKAQAKAAALVLVQEGLDILVVQWGLSTSRHRPPSR